MNVDAMPNRCPSRPCLLVTRRLRFVAFVGAALLAVPAYAQSTNNEFPPVPRPGQAMPQPTADALTIRNMLKVVPLSIAAPTLVLPAESGGRASPLVPNSAPLSQSNIDAGATNIAQVLGSTSTGTVTKAYTITHLRAQDVQALVADSAAPLLPRETSTVIADARSNTLVVKGSEAEHQLVENLIRRVDVPIKQILVEVKIITADDYFGKSLGARFGVTRSPLLSVATPRQQGVQIGGTLSDLNKIATTGTSDFPNGSSLPAINALTSAAVSTLAFGIYKLPAGINIGLELSALEEAGHTKVLSSPKLVLSNFRPGVLSSGQRIPYSRPSIVQGVNTTEFIDAKVSVAVTALIAPDGSISMELTLTDDSVGSTSSIGPTINTNQLTSNVTLKNGETLLLGGFQSATQSQDSNRTPYLADIPLLGNLFKNSSSTALKRELMFVITPTVIEADG